jgi:hypothetical protein
VKGGYCIRENIGGVTDILTYFENDSKLHSVSSKSAEHKNQKDFDNLH